MSDQEFLEFLNETEEPVTIFGMTYSAGNVLKEMDPIAFRVMKNDYMDMHDLEVRGRG